MKIYFLSIFPEIFSPILKSSILGRGYASGKFDFEAVQIRDFAIDSHKSVDDQPYGGGAGMVLRADVLERSLLYAFEKESITPDCYDKSDYSVIVTSASGDEYTQDKAELLKEHKAIFIICGHYEGIDQRFIDLYADYEYRIGDYVVTGGEIPALVIADSILRLIPGVVGSHESLSEESFTLQDQSGKLLEYPHYTRPSVFHDISVPEVLTSGNHQAIKTWRSLKSQELRLKREKLK